MMSLFLLTVLTCVLILTSVFAVFVFAFLAPLIGATINQLNWYGRTLARKFYDKETE